MRQFRDVGGKEASLADERELATISKFMARIGLGFEIEPTNYRCVVGSWAYSDNGSRLSDERSRVGKSGEVTVYSQIYLVDGKEILLPFLVSEAQKLASDAMRTEFVLDVLADGPQARQAAQEKARLAVKNRAAELHGGWGAADVFRVRVSEWIAQAELSGKLPHQQDGEAFRPTLDAVAAQVGRHYGKPQHNWEALLEAATELEVSLLEAVDAGF